MLQAMLKYAPEEALTDDQWTQLTAEEIKRAQSKVKQEQGYRQRRGGYTGPDYHWVFPPESLLERSPAVAAEELMPEVKRTVLARAQANPDQFTLHIQASHIQYDAATGRLLFVAGSVSGKPIEVLKPGNFKDHIF